MNHNCSEQSDSPVKTKPTENKKNNVVGKFFKYIAVITAKTGKSAKNLVNRPVVAVRHLLRKEIIAIFKYLNAFAEKAYAVTTNPFVKIRALFKELSQIPGIFSKFRRISQIMAHRMRSERTVFGKIMSYAAPVAAIAGLVVLIQYFTSQEYVLAVKYEEQVVAYITSETDFDEAKSLIQQQIVYVDDSQQFDLEADFTLAQVETLEEVVDSSELANRLISESQSEISRATGLYINEDFYGAVEDSDALEATLENILDEYKKQTGASEVDFVDEVALSEGLYLQASIVEEEELLKLVTSNAEGEQLYTVVQGDSLNRIADKNDVSVTLLKALNPTVSEDAIAEGLTLKIASSEPILSVFGYKEIQYEEPVGFETIINEDPSIYKNESKVVQEGINGTQRVTALVELVDGEEARREIVDTKITVEPINKIVVQGSKELPEGATVISASSGSNTLAGVSFIRPLQGAGKVSRGITGSHHGVDWAAPSGTPIYASASGTVTLATWYSGYGKCVIVTHGNGVQTLYGHMSTIATTSGSPVAKGQLIGYVGTTGRSTGNHLHFEIRYNGSKLDPFDYVSK